LDSASSLYRKREFFISQQYRFGITKKIVVDDTTTITNFKEAGRLNYIFRYDDSKRVYFDEAPNSGFYKEAYNTTLTYDSLYQSRIENSAFWSFKEIEKENFKGRFSVGSSYDIIKYSTLERNIHKTAAFYINPLTLEIPKLSDTIENVYKTEIYHTIKLFANLSARTKNFIFDVDGSYYLKGQNGYKDGNNELNFLISKSVNILKARTSFYAKLGFKQESPDLFIKKYRSNNFRWENNFNDIISSNLRFGIDIQKIRMNAELLMGTIQNYVYFDSLAMPAQTNNLLNVLTVSVNKDFKFGLFGSSNKFVYQIPNSNDLLRLPDIAAYHSFYFDKFFEKAQIELEFGYDLNYTSKYKAYGYMPASGVFYLANGRYTGNYAIVNAFVKLRIKNVSIYMKMEHINNRFLLDKYYFLADNYPAGISKFKFGVSWRFMN
jgi:hypothetical protein